MSDRKIALVTGANKGIGLATARQLAERGLLVLLGSRDPERGATALPASVPTESPCIPSS
jgi:NAD(P)-dependent dehydrogenase (short-subunit alcohol dehydrogenase family)